MERPFASTPQELLEGIISQDEESLEHLVGYAKQELKLRLAALAIDDSQNERLATIREELVLIFENNDTGVVDALAEPLPYSPPDAEQRWISRSVN